MNNIDLSNRPAVALETTVLTHGMPYPQNIECALACEEAVRRAGAEPYTIGIIDGEIKIGLTKEEIISLAQNKNAIKVSRRDFAYCLSKKLTGSTTVAATMILANIAKIKVFATGGIGGVHRGYNETMDVSADLNEFGKTPVNVICAGPKAILDIPRTLEYLETQGVPVIGYKTSSVPCFYTRESNYKVEIRLDTPKEIAELIYQNEKYNLNQGSLILNPVPKEYSLDFNYINPMIEKAIEDMEHDNVNGKRVTPYLLDKLCKITEGKSLETNMQLIINNAYVAGLIAVELNKLTK